VPGANALAAVSQALLGKPDASEAEVAARVANWTPADELAMRDAEQKFALQMVEQAVALEKINADDRASARDMQKAQRSLTPPILSYSAVLLFAVALGLSYFVPVPPQNHDQVNAMLEVCEGPQLHRVRLLARRQSQRAPQLGDHQPRRGGEAVTGHQRDPEFVRFARRTGVVAGPR